MRYTLLFVVLVACTPKKKQVDVSINIDSIASRWNKDFTQYVRTLSFDRALLHLDSLKPVADSIGNNRLTSFWYLSKGQVYYYKQVKDSAEYCLKMALAVAELANPQSKDVAAAKTQLSILYTSLEKVDTALKLGIEAYELTKKVDTPQLPIACMNLATIYKSIGNQEKYRQFLFEGFRLAKEPPHITMYANDLGKYYESINKDSAIYFYKNVLNFNGFSNPIVTVFKYQNLGKLLIEQGKTQEGIDFLMKAKAALRSINEENPELLMSLADGFTKMRKFQLADRYIDSAISYFTKVGNSAGVSRGYDLRSKIWLTQRNYGNALRFKDSSYYFHKVWDSVSFVKDAQEIATKYEVKVKDERIAGLAIINENKDKINKQQRELIISLSVIILLLVIVSLLLIRRRTLRFKLKELELLHETLRSQMQPHFLFNSLSLLQSILNTGTLDQAKSFLQKLAKISRISFEMSKKKYVFLSDEIMLLDIFLDLYKTHLSDRLEYTIIAPTKEEIEEILIPPMLLQPLVENSIVHGIQKSERNGQIIVEITIKDGYIECIIDDNGIGILSNNSNGGAIRSTEVIIERLAILKKKSRKKSNLTIIDKKKLNIGTGVKAVINVPVLEQNQY